MIKSIEVVDIQYDEKETAAIVSKTQGFQLLGHNNPFTNNNELRVCWFTGSPVYERDGMGCVSVQDAEEIFCTDRRAAETVRAGRLGWR